MKLIYLLCFCLCFGHLDALFAQKSSPICSNHALIWRGFDHSWTYNHRINRLGDYVSLGDKHTGAFSCHTSASGLGADSTFYTSYYSYVQSPHLFFQEALVNIKLDGKEKQLLTKTVDASIPASALNRNQETYVSLLNGFDIQAKRAADKLKLFKIELGDAYYHEASDEIRFQLKVSLSVNCQSLECSALNQKTSYDLKIYCLIIAGEDQAVASNHKTIRKHYSWDKKDEPNFTTETTSIKGIKSEHYKAATAGIKSLSIILNKAHWTVMYNNNIQVGNYQIDKGELSISSNLVFKEWLEGMKRTSAYPKHSQFSSKKKGWATLEMEVVLIQMKDAEILYNKKSGANFWRGQNASPNHPDASMSSLIIINTED